MANQSAHPRTDLTAQLLTGFKDLITRGVLKPGSKLPPERELARMFGVSRSSLRQALKVLDIMGILSQRVGDGSYLRSGASTILNEPLDFLVSLEGIDFNELVEARLIVEPELAARAAERATAEDLRAIEQCLKLMESCKSDPIKIVEEDYAFHQAIHRAARNRICESMFCVAHKAVMTSIMITTHQVELSHTLAFHSDIYKAIRGRKPKQARRVMTEHLVDMKKLLARARGSVTAESIESEIRPIGGRRHLFP
jgi:GntR family transcriptional repressor for pyruvate dehydrogenase complex